MTKKIGILGTRGIPNQYGGFEQWATQLSVALVARGYEVSVYNSHYHPYQKPEYKGVKIIRKWDPKSIGLASQFIYDLLCVTDARKQNFDTIIQLGYTTSSVWAKLLPKSSQIIYNMDGMEWKREKYKGVLSKFLKHAEKLAVKHSNQLIADSLPIKKYLEKKYHVQAAFIPYPADIFSNPDKTVLQPFNIQPDEYFLLIARFQPDNNFETAIQGVIDSKSDKPLIIVGDDNNRYGRFLKKKYNNRQIIFAGKIYDKVVLDNLRYFSALYFHGHSAGGTNPSLLEAMAASCVICAHNNEFNKAVLGEDTYYFNNEKDITEILNGKTNDFSNKQWISDNLNKLRENYTLDKIVDSYVRLIEHTK